MKIKSFLFLLIFFSVSGCAIFRPLPRKLFRNAQENKPYDVIIVPGVPYNGKDWNIAMKGRVIWAVFLVKQGIAKNIIFSGGAVYTPYVEAKVMAIYAEVLGIPRENIFTEANAQHSTENVYNSYQMAKKMGFNKIALATDPVQSSLLMRFTKHSFKLPIAHIPFVVDSLLTMDKVHPMINSDSAKVGNFRSILETQSNWHRFRGTRGKNILYEKE